MSSPRLPEINPEVPDANTPFELSNAIVSKRLVAIISWSKETYQELDKQCEVYDQMLLSKERASHPDYAFYKCNIDGLEPKTVRGILGVHPKVVRQTAGLSIYREGELLGSLEGEEMQEYGLIEQALYSVM
jgi:hypothetical protein